MSSFNALVRQRLAENGELYRSGPIKPGRSYIAVNAGEECWVVLEDVITSVHFWNCDREAVETTIAYTVQASWENAGLAIAHIDRLEAMFNPPAHRRLALAA